MKTRIPAGTTVKQAYRPFHRVFSNGEIEDRRKVLIVKGINQEAEEYTFIDQDVFECIFSQNNTEHCSIKTFSYKG